MGGGGSRRGEVKHRNCTQIYFHITFNVSVNTINMGFIFGGFFEKRGVTWWEVLLPHSSRVPGLILSSGYCWTAVLSWVYSHLTPSISSVQWSHFIIFYYYLFFKVKLVIDIASLQPNKTCSLVHF